MGWSKYSKELVAVHGSHPCAKNVLAVVAKRASDATATDTLDPGTAVGAAVGGIDMVGILDTLGAGVGAEMHSVRAPFENPLGHAGHESPLPYEMDPELHDTQNDPSWYSPATQLHFAANASADPALFENMPVVDEIPLRSQHNT